jgi:hypothetical protein
VFSREDQDFWEEWGTAYPVNPKGLLHKNHDWRSIVRGTAISVEQVEAEVRQRVGPLNDKNPRYRTVTKKIWQDQSNPSTGDPNYAPPVVDVMGNWMKEEDGYVFICHSQGCNTVWHILESACHDKK